MRVETIYALEEGLTEVKMPLYYCTIAAGFPSPADDSIEKRLDLNQLVVKNPTYTFFIRVRGDSMNKAGILDGDILVVDKSVLPEDGRIVVAYINGESTVKRIRYKHNKMYLLPESENSFYQPIVVDAFNDSYEIFGVVIGAYHPF